MGRPPGVRKSNAKSKAKKKAEPQSKAKGKSFAYKKGKYLENAVRAIEELILLNVKGLNPVAIEIIPNYKKIAGYEIDLYVKLKDNFGYDSVFIFETKNLEDAIERKHISDFIDKVRVTSAQRGFFIGKSFTKHAKERIEEDDRIVPIVASHYPKLKIIYCEGSILDVENCKIVELIADGKVIEIDESFKISVGDDSFDSIELIEHYIKTFRKHNDHEATLDEMFRGKNLAINTSPIQSIDTLIVEGKRKDLETRLIRDQLFDIPGKGIHYPMQLYDGDVKVDELTITTVRNGSNIHFKMCFNPNFSVKTYDSYLNLKWKDVFEE